MQPRYRRPPTPKGPAPPSPTPRERSTAPSAAVDSRKKEKSGADAGAKTGRPSSVSATNVVEEDRSAAPGGERTLEERWESGEISASEYARMVVEAEKSRNAQQGESRQGRRRPSERKTDSSSERDAFGRKTSLKRQTSQSLNLVQDAVEATLEASFSLLKTMSLPALVLLLSVGIALVVTVLALSNSMVLGKRLLAIQRIRLSAVSARTASWQALSASHALRSAHASGLMSCNDTSEMLHLNSSFGAGTVQSFYLFNTTRTMETTAANVTTTTTRTETCGWSADTSPLLYPHGMEAQTVHARLSKIIANSTSSSNPWVWAPPVTAATVSAKNQLLLYYVLPPRSPAIGHVIAAVDFQSKMVKEMLSHDQGHFRSQDVTGRAALSLWSRYANDIVASADAALQSSADAALQASADAAALQCIDRNSSAKIGSADSDEAQSASEYITECTRVDSEETKLFPNNLLVGVSVAQSHVYPSQQTVLILTVTIAVGGLALILFSQVLTMSGSLSVDESITLAALVTAIVTFLTLTSCVSMTDTHLQKVVSDVGHLQARSLDENIQHEIGKYTSALDFVRRTIEADLGREHRIDDVSQYYSTGAVLDLAELAMQGSTTPVDMVYVGEASTGNFYGTTTYNDPATNASYVYSDPVRFAHFNESTRNDSYRTSSYAIGGADGRTVLRERRVGPQDVNPYDPRQRPWYKSAVQWRQSGNHTAIWSSVYSFFSGVGLGITLAQAFCHPNGTVVGVIGIDFTLDSIGELLDARVQELGKFNESTSLWMSEGNPKGFVVGVGGGAKELNAMASEESATGGTTGESRYTAKRLGGKFERTYDSLVDGVGLASRMEFGFGVGKEVLETRRLAKMAEESAGMDWWLVQSINFRDFIRGVYSQGSTALLYGLLIAGAGATLTVVISRVCLVELLGSNQETGVAEKQRREVAIAAKMRRDTIAMSKKKTKHQLLKLAEDLMLRSNRDYPRVFEFWSLEMMGYSSTDLSSGRVARAWLHSRMTGDSDSVWMWLLFSMHFMHMVLSFWDAPTIASEHLNVVLTLQGVCIGFEVIDVAVRIFVAIPVDSMGGGFSEKSKDTDELSRYADREMKTGCCRWRMELDVPSLRVSLGSIRLRGAVRIFCIFMLIAEWSYRMASFGEYTTTWTAPLRALIVVTCWDAPRAAFSAFFGTVWAARDIFLLGLQFLLFVIVIMLSTLQHAYSDAGGDDEIGRGLSSPEGSFLTMFIYTYFAAGYETLTYEHKQVSVVPYSIFFLVVIFTGVFLFLAILLSVFQSEFSTKTAAHADARRRERRDGHQLVFLLLNRLEAVRDDSEVIHAAHATEKFRVRNASAQIERRLSKAASRVSQLANFELAHKLNVRKNSSVSAAQLDRLRSKFASMLRVKVQTVKECLLCLPGADDHIVEQAILEGLDEAGASAGGGDDSGSKDLGSESDFDDEDTIQIDYDGEGAEECMDMTEFHIVSETFRNIVGPFRVGGTGCCRNWTWETCLGEVHRGCCCCCCRCGEIRRNRVAPTGRIHSVNEVDESPSNVTEEDTPSSLVLYCRDVNTPLCCCCCSAACQRNTTKSARLFFDHPLFGYWRLVLVLGNAWMVCFLATDTGQTTKGLHAILTTTVLSLHLVEMLSQSIMQGPSYFSSLARRTDFAIVVASTVVFLAFYGPVHLWGASAAVTGKTSATLNTTMENVLSTTVPATVRASVGTPEKLAIALPCLRLFTVVKSTQKLSVGLLSLFPKFYDLALLLILFLYVFASIGTPLFAGKLKQFSAQGDVHPAANFDTFGETLRTLFHLLLGEFSDIMYAGIDSHGSMWVSVYFVGFALMCSLIFTNLVIGVICELFMTDVYSIMQVSASEEPAEAGLTVAPSSPGHGDGSGKSFKSGGGGGGGDSGSDRMKKLEEVNRQLRKENEQLVSVLNRTRLRAALPAILRKRTVRMKKKKTKRGRPKYTGAAVV